MVSGEWAVRVNIFHNWSVVIPISSAKKTLLRRFFHMLQLLNDGNLGESEYVSAFKTHKIGGV